MCFRLDSSHIIPWWVGSCSVAYIVIIVVCLIVVMIILISFRGTEPSSICSNTTITRSLLGDVFRLLKSESCDWQEIGRALNVEYDFRQGLLQQGVMTSNKDKLEVVLNN